MSRRAPSIAGQGELFGRADLFPVRRPRETTRGIDLSLRIKTAMGEALRTSPYSAEVLAAMVNGMVVAGVGVVVLVEGVNRALHPRPVEAGLMLTVALVGLAANAAGIGLLHRGQGESITIRGAYLEVLGDLLGSVAVVAAALVVLATGFTRADGIASVLVGLVILPRAAVLLHR